MRSCEMTFTAGTGVRRLELREGTPILIGRSRRCHLHINSPRLSRTHCVLEYGVRGPTLQDQGSSNGTFINGRRVDQVLIRPGDILQMGGIAIRIDYDPTSMSQVDLRCERCGSMVSMARCEDGQVFELGKAFLCANCMAVLRHENLSQAEQHMVEVLAELGFRVEGKTPLSAGIIPVFSALRLDLGTRVLIKALPLLAGVSQKKIKRFQSEAKTAAKVRHENVVEIYDIRQAEHALFIVMEHVEGELLLAHIERKGKLALRQGLRVGLRVARALAEAHRQGIVHRDLKPGGILIDAQGSPKVCDFGLAKDLWSITSDVTGPEETLGTVRYMPPEQVKNAREADHRADIYSWGATLFHALTGRPPYHDRGELELMGQVISGKLDAFDPQAPELPPSVAALLRRCMQPNPVNRPQSAEDLEAALGEVIIEQSGIPGFKGDPELLLSLDPRMLDSGRHRPSSPGGMSGSFERGAELIEFLQMIEFNKKSGILSVQGTHSGHLGFVEGRLRAAVSNAGQRGDEAVHVLLGVKKGHFEFRPQLPPGFRAEMDRGINGLLLDVLRRQDEESGETGPL